MSICWMISAFLRVMMRNLFQLLIKLPASTMQQVRKKTSYTNNKLADSKLPSKYNVSFVMAKYEAAILVVISAKKTIVFITPGVETGGAEKQLALLAKGLSQDGLFL